MQIMAKSDIDRAVRGADPLVMHLVQPVHPSGAFSGLGAQKKVGLPPEWKICKASVPICKERR